MPRADRRATDAPARRAQVRQPTTTRRSFALAFRRTHWASNRARPRSPPSVQALRSLEETAGGRQGDAANHARANLVWVLLNHNDFVDASLGRAAPNVRQTSMKHGLVRMTHSPSRLSVRPVLRFARRYLDASFHSPDSASLAFARDAASRWFRQ